MPSDQLTDAELKAIDARCKAATEGPWAWSGRKVDDEGYVYIPQGSHLAGTLIVLDDNYEECDKDCEFIAHARTDVERLVADLQAMRAVIRDADLETWMRNAIAAGRVD